MTDSRRNWRVYVSKYLPWIPSFKRQIVAAKDSLLKRGGSQCGEDFWLINEMNESKIDWKNVRYVEIGANQPTQLSNTWRMYQLGARGLLIEPDPRCVSLLRYWRPADIVIEALAGEKMGVERLKLHRYTTMNSISGEGDDYIGEILVPICNLDTLYENLRRTKVWDKIDFLSIDTEGHDHQVLLGSSETLKNVKYISLENWNDAGQTVELTKILSSDFVVVHQTALNVIFKRVTPN